MTTQEKIKALRDKVDAIDKAYEEAPKWQTSHRIYLNKQGGEVEKEIKRLQYLDGLSGNVVHETIGCLQRLLNLIDGEYCHIENEITKTKTTIKAELKEFTEELDRRIEEDNQTN